MRVLLVHERFGAWGGAEANLRLVAEALQHRGHALPVVAFDTGGIREWLRDGETGFLVPWMDTAQYAARLERLLPNKPACEPRRGPCRLS